MGSPGRKSIDGKFPLSEKPEKILIIKPSALGDIVNAIPVLRGLRRTFPEARIDWLVVREWADIISHDPDLNETIIFDRKFIMRSWFHPDGIKKITELAKRVQKGKYDWAIDLQGLFVSALFARVSNARIRIGLVPSRECASLFYTHKIEASRDMHMVDRLITLAKEIGVDVHPDDYRPEIPYEGRKFASEFREKHDLNEKGFIIVNAPTTWPTKHYPIRHWRVVVSELSREIPVVLTGGKKDTESAEEIIEGLDGKIFDMTGRTDLVQYIGLIASSSCVICPDTSAAHIAAASGVPSIVICGPTRPSRTGAYRLGTHILAQVECQGCLKRKLCSNFICMDSIDPQAVIDSARKIISVKVAPDKSDVTL
ncbi:MAG: glycosyltransferase family 9 protein [bacterium]